MTEKFTITPNWISPWVQFLFSQYHSFSIGPPTAFHFDDDAVCERIELPIDDSRIQGRNQVYLGLFVNDFWNY